MNIAAVIEEERLTNIKTVLANIIVLFDSNARQPSLISFKIFFFVKLLLFLLVFISPSVRIDVVRYFSVIVK